MVWAHPCFITAAAWTVLGEAAVCSSYLSFPVSLCSHASEHLPLQMQLQPLISSLKIMKILMPMLTNGSFIHSFMHTHSCLRQQPASLCSCWRRFLGIVFVCRGERQFLPAKNGVSGLWSLEHRTEWCRPILCSVCCEKRHLSSCTF